MKSEPGRLGVLVLSIAGALVWTASFFCIGIGIGELWGKDMRCGDVVREERPPYFRVQGGIIMPIRAEQKHLYPANWPEVRERIRARARGKLAYEGCEWCGVRNHAIGTRDEGGRFHESVGCGSEELLDGEKSVRIVCTVAHYDHDPTNNDDGNLWLLCQQCHNGHDAKHRAAGIRRRRDSRAGQGRLFEEVET